MNAYETIAKIIAALDACQIPYMLTGSFASSYYGVPRSTRDIDLVIDPNEGQLRNFIGALDPHKYYAEMGAAISALKARSIFNLMDMESGWKVDLIIRKARAFSQEEFRRRYSVQIHGLSLCIATIEDIVIAKLEWSKLGQSQRQIEDVSALLRARWTTLNRDYIELWSRELGITDQWHQARSDARV